MREGSGSQRGASVGLALVGLWLALPVRAQPNAQLQWQPPPPADCVDLEALERTVEARLSRNAFAPAADALQIVAAFGQRDAQPSVELRIASAAGQPLGARTLSAADCQQLSAALPVVLAVLLDLQHEGAQAAEAQPSIAAPAPPAAPASVTRAEPSGLRSGLALSAAGGFVLGRQPGIAWGGGLDAAIGLWRPLAVAVWGELYAPSHTAGTVQLVMWSMSLAAGACLADALSGRFRAGLCAGGGAARLAVSGRGLEIETADARWLPELRLLGHMMYSLHGPMFIRLETGGLVPLERPHYVYVAPDGSRVESFRPAPIAWLLRLGISLVWL